MAELYDQNMSGVDLLDQKLGTYMYQHKLAKWRINALSTYKEVLM